MVHSGRLFWCYYKACKTRVEIRKAVLCANRFFITSMVSTANWSVISHGGRIIDDIIHINTYIRVSSQPVRHICSLYCGHSRHTRTCYRLSLYILLSCILFQEIKLLFTKVTFCWCHVYFYEHVSGVWSVIKFHWSTAGSKPNQLYNRRTSMENYS